MRIGLTQRVEVIPSYGERRDCLDQEWAQVVHELGGFPIPLANGVAGVADYLQGVGIDCLIFTGGNDLAHLENAVSSAPERDRFEHDALKWAVESRIPVLGVCRGMQFINNYFGGQLCKIQGHVGTNHSVFYNQMPFEVNSFHNWAIPLSGLGDDLEAVAFDADGNVEAFFCKDCLILGIMWHPEREAQISDLDKELMNSFLRI